MWPGFTGWHNAACVLLSASGMNNTKRGFFRGVVAMLAVSAAALTGCSSDPREGEMGNATFAYRSSRGCADLFGDGCVVGSGALLVGVNETLQVEVSASDDPRGDLTLTSLSPDVVAAATSVSPDLERSPHRYQFRLTALARGTARVELRRGDGSVVDRVAVRVDEAAAIDLVNEDAQQGALSAGAARFTTRMGAQGSVTGFARDAAGRRLFGNDAVVWELESAGVAELGFGFMTGTRVADDHVYVRPLTPGVVRATVRAGAVTRALEIAVTP